MSALGESPAPFETPAGKRPALTIEGFEDVGASSEKGSVQKMFSERQIVQAPISGKSATGKAFAVFDGSSREGKEASALGSVEHIST